MQRFYYLGSLLVVFAIPAGVIMPFIIHQIPIANLILFLVGILFLGSVWDVWATRHGKKDAVWIWQFNHKDTIGVTLFDIPLEEYLFYLLSSAYIIFLWEAIKLALSTDSPLLSILIATLALWSLLGAMFPYWIKPRGDRIAPPKSHP
jgi:lycopene cyclase domain-containing protein